MVRGLHGHGLRAVLALPGNTFATGAHWQRFAAIMPEGNWAALMVALAVVRMVALTINGGGAGRRCSARSAPSSAPPSGATSRC